MNRSLLIAILLAGGTLTGFSAESSRFAPPILAIPGANDDGETSPAHSVKSERQPVAPVTTKELTPAEGTKTSESDSPHEILRDLKEGNLRFVSDRMVHNLTSAARRAELAEIQHPTVTVLTCSDSRVPPELIFDKGLGELYTIRVAGNVADTDEIGSIEFGVGQLHTPVLLVLGHTSCAAITAVARNEPVTGSIPKLLTNIVPAVLRAKDEASSPEGIIDAAVRANVWVAIEDIFRRSEVVRRLAAEGKVRVIGAVYDLQTGIVSWMGSHPSQKTLIAQASAGATNDDVAATQGQSDVARIADEHPPQPVRAMAHP